MSPPLAVLEGRSVRCPSCLYVIGTIQIHEGPAEIVDGVVDYDPGPGIAARTFLYGWGWKQYPDPDGVRRMKADSARRVRDGKAPHHAHGRPDLETLSPRGGVWVRWSGAVMPQEVECPFGHRALLDAHALRVSAGALKIEWRRSS